jgi:hypothetical protein
MSDRAMRLLVRLRKVENRYSRGWYISTIITGLLASLLTAVKTLSLPWWQSELACCGAWIAMIAISVTATELATLIRRRRGR